MTLPEIGVFASIAASVVCWAGGEVLRSRAAWTYGAALAVLHSALSFAVFLHWSHDAARALTARQTEALLGIAFGGGVYVNYLFLAVWIADVLWWWGSPRSYVTRPAGVSFAIRGFIFFIILNGAVLFADGLARIVGIAATATVALSTIARRVLHFPA